MTGGANKATTHEQSSLNQRLADVVHSIAVELVPYLAATITQTALPDHVDRRRRSAMRLGALACQGSTGEMLESEISDALANGVSSAEIVEVMIHTIPYVGIPRPLNSILASKAIFSAKSLLPISLDEPKWPDTERLSVGLQQITEAHPLAAPILEENLAPIAPSLYRYIVTAAFKVAGVRDRSS